MTLVLTVAIIGVAFFGEAVFGFGGGLISIPLLSLFLGVKKSVTLVLIFQLLLGLLILHAYKVTDWKVVRPALAPLLVGSMVGTFSLAHLNENSLRLVLALAILFYLGKQFFFDNGKLGRQRPALFGAIGGGLGGLCQGLIGTGGPALVVYLNEMDLPKEVFRASIIVMLFACNLTRLVASVSAGLFTSDVIEDALYALPVFLIALYAGHKMHLNVSQRIYGIGIYSVLALSAASLMYKFAISH